MIELRTEEPQKSKTHTWQLYWLHATDPDASYRADEETLRQAGFIRKSTPEPGEPVGGKADLVDAAGEVRLLKEELQRVYEANDVNARLYREAQSALTCAGGRVRELERTVDIVVGDLCAVRGVAMERAPSLVFAAINGAITRLRAQPPLASSVVADEATTGEQQQDPRRSPGGDTEHTDPSPTERHSGKLGTGPGHQTSTPVVEQGIAPDAAEAGGGGEVRYCAVAGCHRPVRSAAIHRYCDRHYQSHVGLPADGRSSKPKPSPLTGEEGKAERVDRLPDGFVDAFCSAEHLWVQGKTHEALGRLCTAVARLGQALESRAAKGGSGGR